MVPDGAIHASQTMGWWWWLWPVGCGTTCRAFRAAAGSVFCLIAVWTFTFTFPALPCP
ncbi:hypothetical protein CCACVL1_09708 [Corchorus capsularis]|uniref:Uncharacterized protein n=1 Tax=Corchorus capsularis TaxID=210143 RepID=A0A1R3IUH9_COCAP|nr:hypothetical protein CCACVL1_09708 [Corchorus capsularis]